MGAVALLVSVSAGCAHAKTGKSDNNKMIGNLNKMGLLKNCLVTYCALTV
jgi:hypothetical protein